MPLTVNLKIFFKFFIFLAISSINQNRQAKREKYCKVGIGGVVWI